MKKIILLVITSLLTFLNVYAQSTYTEVLESFKNGNDRIILHKNGDLKIIDYCFLNINGDTISKIRLNPVSGLLDGDFFDPYQKGYFKNGLLNCSDCVGTLIERKYNEEINYVFKFKSTKGIVNGKVTVYKQILKNHYNNEIYNLEGKNELKVIPSFILSNIAIFNSKNNDINNFNILHSELNYQNSLLEGKQILNYNIFENERLNQKSEIIQSIAHYEKSKLTGLITFSEKEKNDSLFSYQDVWLVNGKYIEGKKELFEFNLNSKLNSINFSPVRVGLKNPYYSNDFKINTKEEILRSYEHLYLFDTYFNGSFDEWGDVSYLKPQILFYPSNFNQINDGLWSINFEDRHLNLNDQLLKKIEELILHPNQVFKSDYNYLPKIEKPSRPERYIDIGSEGVREIERNFLMNERLAEFKDQTIDTPLEFFSILLRLKNENIIYLNDFFVNFNNEKISSDFKKVYDKFRNDGIVKFELNQLNEYFKYLNEKILRYRNNKITREPLIDKLINEFKSIKIGVKIDYNDTYKYSKLNKGYIDYYTNTISSTFDYDNLFFLTNEEFQIWLDDKKNLLEKSKMWVDLVEKWDEYISFYEIKFWSLLSNYPINSIEKKEVIRKIKIDGINSNSSFFEVFLPDTDIFKISNNKEFYDNLQNNYQRFKVNQLIEINNNFDFKDFLNNYKKIVEFSKINLPEQNNILPLYNKIENLYKKQYVENLKKFDSIPFNFRFYTDETTNDYIELKAKKLVNNFNIKYEHFWIFILPPDLGYGFNINFINPKNSNGEYNLITQYFFKKEKDYLDTIKLLNEKKVDFLYNKVDIIKYFETDDLKKFKDYTYSILLLSDPTDNFSLN